VKRGGAVWLSLGTPLGEARERGVGPAERAALHQHGLHLSPPHHPLLRKPLGEERTVPFEGLG